MRATTASDLLQSHGNLVQLHMHQATPGPKPTRKQMIKKLGNGMWELNIQPGGRSGRRVKRQFPTKTDALQYKNSVLAKIATDPDWKPIKENRSLASLIDTWFLCHGKTLSAGKDTKHRLELIDLSLGNPTAKAVTTKNLAEYRAQRVNEGVSNAGVNREIAYLKAMFNKLAEFGEWRLPNPCTPLKPFSVQESELTYLTDKQLQRLLQELTSEKRRNPHVDLCTRLALSTGARWSEAEGITIDRVEHGQVQFAKTKGRKVRHVPISKDLEKELREHHTAWSEKGEKRIFGPSWGAFREAVKDAEIELPEGQMTHVCRHTFASCFLQRGGDILTLQKLLGHTDIKLTMRYSHMAPNALAKAVKLNPLAEFNKSSTKAKDTHPKPHQPRNRKPANTGIHG